jgi:hypothetical protein
MAKEGKWKQQGYAKQVKVRKAIKLETNLLKFYPQFTQLTDEDSQNFLLILSALWKRKKTGSKIS